MKKLLRSPLFKLVFILVVAAGLFVLQNYIDAQVNGIKATTDVYVVNKKLESKDKIEANDVKKIEVMITDVPENSIKKKSDIVGKYVIVPITKGAFILTHNLSPVKNFEATNIKEGYKMISLPLSIDNAVGWKIEKKQIVEMIFSPTQYKNVVDNSDLLKNASVLYSPRVIEEVEIVDIMNEALISIDNAAFAGTPKYIVILLKADDAEFIAKAKDKGRFDILITNSY